MPHRKHQPDEIVAMLRQVDELLSQGRPVAEVIRTISVTPPRLRRRGLHRTDGEAGLRRHFLCEGPPRLPTATGNGAPRGG